MSQHLNGFRLGQFVRDTEKEAVCVVVAIHETAAHNFEIPALDGATVADCNPDQWHNDHVVQVVYSESANYRLDEWTPTELAVKYQENEFASIPGLRAYSMPVGRLERISTPQSS